MSIRPNKMSAIALSCSAAMFCGTNIAHASGSGPDAGLIDVQKAYRLAAEQGAPRPYFYVDLQSGEVVRSKCESANGKRVKRYVELPTGKVLHWNCGK